jgi:hypothetical protein
MLPLFYVFCELMRHTEFLIRLLVVGIRDNAIREYLLLILPWVLFSSPLSHSWSLVSAREGAWVWNSSLGS